MAKTRNAKPCSACGQRGHRSDNAQCPKKAGRGGANHASKPPKPARAAVPTDSATNGLVAHIRQLTADVARGEQAKAELDEVRQLLA